MPLSSGGLVPGGGAGSGGGGSGTVTSVSVVSANGLNGTVATPTTTPAITLSTTVTGILKGNGTTISAGVAGTDYSAGTSALATGIVKSTTVTGALSIAAPGTDYPATGVISAGGPTGSSTVVPVITWNANGQLTAVTTATIAPAVLPSQFTTSTVTADPNPGVVGTYYRTNYAANGNFTLPTTSLTAGQWIWVKQVANNTLSIVGTVDGNASFTMTQFQSYLFIYNGTNWDVN